MHLFLPVELLVALVFFLLPQTTGELLVAGSVYLGPVAFLDKNMSVLFVFQSELLALARLSLSIGREMGGIVIEVH